MRPRTANGSAMLLLVAEICVASPSPPRAALAEDGAVNRLQARCACLPLPPGLTSSYLANSLQRVSLGHPRTTAYIRFASSQAVVIQSTRLFTVDDLAVTRTWNSLSDFVTSSSSLPTFKRHLKTARSYPSL